MLSICGGAMYRSVHCRATYRMVHGGEGGIADFVLYPLSHAQSKLLRVTSLQRPPLRGMGSHITSTSFIIRPSARE